MKPKIVKSWDDIPTIVYDIPHEGAECFSLRVLEKECSKNVHRDDLLILERLFQEIHANPNKCIGLAERGIQTIRRIRYYETPADQNGEARNDHENWEGWPK